MLDVTAALAATANTVTIAVDLAELPKLISDSVRKCLAKHGIVLPAAVEAEVGRNVAAAVQLDGEDRYEQQFAAAILAGPVAA